MLQLLCGKNKLPMELTETFELFRFGFYNPYWLIDIANAAIFVHLLGAYQARICPSIPYFCRVFPLVLLQWCY